MNIVTLDQLAADLGISRTNARRVALRYGAAFGFAPVRRQVNGVGRHQRVLTWTRSEANQILAARKREGFLTGDGT